MSDQKLEVLRLDNDVVLRVKLLGTTFDCKFTCGSWWSAQLLRDAIAESLGDSMEEARRDSYADGWRHAKAKTARATYFFRRLP
jgi:hypothetical protein